MRHFHHPAVLRFEWEPVIGDRRQERRDRSSIGLGELVGVIDFVQRDGAAVPALPGPRSRPSLAVRGGIAIGARRRSTRDTGLEGTEILESDQLNAGLLIKDGVMLEPRRNVFVALPYARPRNAQLAHWLVI